MREHFIFCYRFNLGHVERLISDLTDEQMVAQPHGLVNHPAWTLKHLVLSSDYGAQLFGLESTIPEDWKGKSSPGSLPSGDASQYPSKEVLLAALRVQHDRITDVVLGVEASFFDQDCPSERLRSHFPKMGDFVGFLMASHEAGHIGQLAAWRRAMGLDPVRGG